MNQKEMSDVAVRQLEGRVYGMKTAKGIALLQIVAVPAPKSLRLTRICDGFLHEKYTENDILEILNRKELFFMNTCLGFTKNSKLYKEFFVFDKVFDIPRDVVLPTAYRGYTPYNDGSGFWYYKKAPDWIWQKVGTDPSELTDEYLSLPPDSAWSFPRIREFLESGKAYTEWLY